ncbi:NUDIX hydrolase [Nocardiopsis sp. CA-288880]|uniref:NUDIX hydrolase n=1 Tax=Nocardiopsis sp. CA-288880 TaxID=3239995 RepID=UPI003D996A54
MTEDRTPEHDEPESRFLSGYDPHAFAPAAVTVDVVALTIRPEAGTGETGSRRTGTPHVLLTRRAAHPQRGRWALPGGFVRAEDGPDGPADPDLPDAALRVLSEKTRLPTELHLEQLGTYGARGRDPRMRVFSVAHMLLAPDLPDPHSGRDTEEAAWVPWSELGHGEGSRAGRDLAFDHGRILADAVERARSKLEYTALATAFLPSAFTITALREVYQAVWGRTLHAANFHRKILATPGFVEDTGELAEHGGSGGGRRARLYRAGGAALLHPPLLRSAQ